MESATSMVVEGSLSSLFQVLLEKVGLLFGVEEEAKKLGDVLQRIQSYLSDAEDRQIKEESVRLWLTELKYAAYDAEDIFDELDYRALGSKVEKAAAIQTKKRKLTHVRYVFSRFRSNLDLGTRMKEIRERLETIENKSHGLHLINVMYQSERLNPSKERPQTSSVVDESTVIGRDADKEKVISLLKSDNDHSSSSSSSSSSAAAGGRYGLQVIPICGMGGLGKTTLAQMVYNDERVNEHFEVRGWVYVSQDFDLIRLSKAILLSFSGSSPDPTNLDLIQVGIKKALNDKKFLLVLDDVWNDNCNDWDALRAPLMSGARGSRILVTTRSQRVSSIVGTVPTHFLQGLSDDECWSLFERRAFVEGNSDAHSDLKKIGEKIVKKCNGLPLAVKSLGGLLRSKVDVVQWEAILESEIWGLSDDKNDILPALRLSYHHLPAQLKRCFAYCCMFGKGFKKDGNELVLKWMAQGYIQSEGSKQMEDIGREYLDYLVSWSLLDTDSEYDVDPYIKHTIFDGGRLLHYVSYTMHDLSHDLARSVLGAEFLDVGDVKSHKNVEKACQIAYHLSRTKSFDYEDLCRFKSLRTHMFLEYPVPRLTYNIPADFFINLTHLRLLELTNSSLKELPESIGNLIHLRLLDLSHMEIERLPMSITRLYHLQTLKLDYCLKLVELPSDFSNLVNLRHLSLQYCDVSMPPGIGRLTNLHEMGKFNVKKENGCRINELKDMIHLQRLCISKLENVVNVQEAKEAELNRKPKIHRLQLEWKTDEVELRLRGIEEKVLEGLQPHTNLKELKITGYCGRTFPRWLGCSSFSNLFDVSLYRCRCPVLPPFGQLPALKTLYLGELFRLEKVDREFYGDGTVEGGFPSLQELTFESMPDLEAWSAFEGVMSHVSTIIIRECSKLRELPPFPLTLKSVKIEYCERLATPSWISRLSTIRELTLSGCDQQMLSSVQYLTSLSSLKIFEFPNLTLLPPGLLQPLTALEELEISECNQLVSLSEEVGLLHLTSLRSLRISDCCNLNCLTPGLQHLTSLESLKVSKCLRLTSLVDVLPTTLRCLRIWDCRNLNCLPINLTSLVELTLIDCPQIHSLPEELSTTLQSVYISTCPNLTNLPTGLQNLSSLTLEECPKIHSLPEELPTTLQWLEIAGCPLLYEKYQKGGDDWCKLSHIRTVWILEKTEEDDLD